MDNELLKQILEIVQELQAGQEKLKQDNKEIKATLRYMWTDIKTIDDRIEILEGKEPPFRRGL